METQYCPNCNPQRKLYGNGTTKAGNKRLRCLGCPYSTTLSDNIQGSQPKYGPTAQTVKQRVRRHRGQAIDPEENKSD